MSGNGWVYPLEPVGRVPLVDTVEVSTLGDVSLSVPAKAEFLHVVRAVVSGVAARRSLSYDAINDLCLAASEAAAYLLALPSGPGGRRLFIRIRVEGSVDLTVSLDAPAPNWPPASRQTLAWRVLSGLVDGVAFVLEEGCPAITLTMRVPGAGREATV